MADLNAGIILQGVDTTNPVRQIPLGEQVEQGARTGLMQAQAGAATVGAQGEQLKNQVTLMNLRSQQAWGQATIQALAGLRQAHNQQVAANTDPSTAGTIDPSAPPAPQGVDPYAWKAAQDNNWTIDQSMDWYKDADGNPISHSAGPAFSPSGRPNLYSHEVLGAIADKAQALGANPMFLAQQFQDNADKALAFDKENATVAKNMADMSEARARANNLGAQTSVIIQNTSRNHADDVMLNPDPASQTSAALFQTQQMPKLWVPKLQAAGVQVGTDPNSGVVIANTADPRFLQVFSQEAKVSPNYLERQKLASENAERGTHIVNGVDQETGNPVSSIVKIDANTGQAQVLSTGLSPPGILTPAQIKASGELVRNYDAPMPTASTPNAARIRQYVQDNGDVSGDPYDATRYAAKQQARVAFGPNGKAGQNITSIETALNHIQAYKDAFAQINNNQFPVANRILNSIGVQTGNGAITSAELASIVAGDETIKAVVGAQSGEKERQNLVNILSAKGASPDMVNKNAAQLLDLLGGRIGPQILAAKKAGLSPSDLAVSPRTLALPSVQQYITGNGPPAATPVASTIKPGDFVDGGDGHTYVLKPGAPANSKNKSDYQLVK